jgi:tetratricopeptide (TPR) repeat protein
LWEADPEFLPAANNLAGMLICLERPRDTVQMLKPLVRKGNGPAFLEFNLGYAYFELEMDLETQNHLNRALQLEPSLAAAHYQLSLLYKARNNRAKAMTAWGKAFALDSAFKSDYLGIGARVAPVLVEDENWNIPEPHFLPPKRR